MLHSQGSFGPFNRTDSGRVVVRTSDGKVVSGKLPSVTINANSTYAGDVVTAPPFKPRCYQATAARAAQFDGKPAEELTLVYTCGISKRSGDFKLLYLDPQTHRPLAAVDRENSPPVSVSLEQRFTPVGDRVLPSALNVIVKGSGFMSWLDVKAHEIYSDFAFYDRQPPNAASASPASSASPTP
jgi:hypothetical protein